MPRPILRGLLLSSALLGLGLSGEAKAQHPYDNPYAARSYGYRGNAFPWSYNIPQYQLYQQRERSPRIYGNPYFDSKSPERVWTDHYINNFRNPYQ